MRVLIRTDASNAIGTGHFMRCLALAHGLRAQGDSVVFASAALPRGLSRMLGDAGIQQLRLDAGRGLDSGGEVLPATAQERDAVMTRKLASAVFGWVVVDHYGLDAQWERCMAQPGEQILVVDDLANRHHECNLLLDQNPGATKEARYRALIPPSARLLLGPRYALLRAEFSQARKNAGLRAGPVRRILVMFGGADPTGECRKAVDALSSVSYGIDRIDVVAGAANPMAESLRAACRCDTRMHFHETSEHVAQLMADADLALGACGVSSWERCSVYLPCIAVITAENQREIGAALSQSGAAQVLGWYADINAEDFRSAVSDFAAAPERLRAMSARAGTITDGEGTRRVILAMENSHAN